LSDFQRRPKRFGQFPAIGTTFQMGLDLLIPRLAGGKRTTRQYSENLIAIHRNTSAGSSSLRRKEEMRLANGRAGSR
jgi:hypothetical protein